MEGQRADAVPAVFTDIHVHYTVAGPDLDPRKVERAVALSMEKYCSVTRMLQSSVAVTHSFRDRSRLTGICGRLGRRRENLL